MLLTPHYIPNLTSVAGSCLSAANWQEIGIHSVAYYLDSLLVKPGPFLLKQIPSLSTYMGWPGAIILNASRLKANKSGMFLITSTYDGSKIHYSYSDLIDLIIHLKPTAVLLPHKIMQDVPDFWERWDNSIIPFFTEEDLMQQEMLRPHGVYFEFQKNVLSPSSWNHLQSYVFGEISLDKIKELGDEGITYIETDQPANAAYKGQVFGAHKIIDIQGKSSEQLFESINTDCACPTCSQKLTMAYLHHLFLNTPLLCQRFLIQHNAFVAASASSTLNLRV